MKASLLLSSALLLLSINPAGAFQEQKQEQKKKAEKDWVIELRTVLVELQAVVTDKGGHLVSGLRKEDFELREKGRLQDISSFAEQRVGPLAIAESVNVVNVPNLSELPPPPQQPARSLLLFVDTLDMSGPNVLRMKQSLRKFIGEQLTDQDAVMLITSSGMEGIPARFTRDRTLLRHYVDRIAAWGSINSYFTPYLAAQVRHESEDAIDVAIGALESEGLNAQALSRQTLRQIALGKALEVLAEASYKRSSVLGTFKAAAELMSRAPGQRVMLLLSDGFSLFDIHGNIDSPELKNAISKAVRAGVVVYSISSKGLEAPAEVDASRHALSTSARTGSGFDPTLLGKLSSYTSASEKEVQDGMNLIARETGGDAFFRTNDINWALKKSFEGSHIYYALAYYPSNEGEGLREISLRVKGHPEYSVRTQKGYLATDAGKKSETLPKSLQQRLFEAMARPMSESAINVNAWANYLEVGSDNKQVSIQVQMDGSRLTYHEENDRASVAVEVAVSIYDRAGKLVDRFVDKIAGRVPLARLSEVKSSGFSYGRRIELKPGFYLVRVGVLEPETENMGTASAWVEVPDLSKGKLALSSIVLSPVDDEHRPVYGSPQLEAIKSYKAGSHLAYYLMVYNTGSSVASELTIQSEIALGEKVVFQSDPQPISTRMLGTDGKGIQVGGQLNLNLEPGFYELRLAMKDKSNHEFRRSVDFLVEH